MSFGSKMALRNAMKANFSMIYSQMMKQTLFGFRGRFANKTTILLSFCIGWNNP